MKKSREHNGDSPDKCNACKQSKKVDKVVQECIDNSPVCSHNHKDCVPQFRTGFETGVAEYQQLLKSKLTEKKL